MMTPLFETSYHSSNKNTSQTTMTKQVKAGFSKVKQFEGLELQEYCMLWEIMLNKEVKCRGCNEKWRCEYGKDELEI